MARINRRMDDLEAELGPVHARITAFARRQAGCKTLARELFGVGSTGTNLAAIGRDGGNCKR